MPHRRLYSGLCTMVRRRVFFQTMVVSVILPRATASRPTTSPMTTVVMHFTIVWGFSLQNSNSPEDWRRRLSIEELARACQADVMRIFAKLAMRDIKENMTFHLVRPAHSACLQLSNDSLLS